MSQGFEIESRDALNSSRNQLKPIDVPGIEAIQQSLVQHGDIQEPRIERTKKHLLTDILEDV